MAVPLDLATRREPHYHELHPLLIACTFIRILPYVRDTGALDFVQQRVGAVFALSTLRAMGIAGAPASASGQAPPPVALVQPDASTAESPASRNW